MGDFVPVKELAVVPMLHVLCDGSLARLAVLVEGHGKDLLGCELTFDAASKSLAVDGDSSESDLLSDLEL